MSLFDRQDAGRERPLAERMRPRDLEEFVGQRHLVGEGSLLRKALETGEVPSMILWGPPGTGKTTLVRILARESGMVFRAHSAVMTGLKEVRQVIAQADRELQAYGRRTLLFIDEIHRFNKAQQDAFLPHVEKGTVTLVGATTENPSFEVISALMSRCTLFVLEPLSPEEVALILRRALDDEERGLGGARIRGEEGALRLLAERCDGDARRALNALDLAAASLEEGGLLDEDGALEALQSRGLLYDREGEEHYNLISAFHKAVRGSDPDGALYWLARMLAGGEEPLYLARRMVRIASEDVGNADPRALSVCIAARDAFHFLGSPEGELALAQAALYLATAPKSNAAYKAFTAVKKEVERGRADPVPLHIRNAPTRLMKGLGYGKGYRYDHDWNEALAPQTYLPDRLAGRLFYHPTNRGEEKAVADRLARWRKMREERLRGEKKGARPKGRGPRPQR